MDFDDLLLGVRLRARDAIPPSPGPSAGGGATSSSTSSRTSTRCSTGCCGPGWEGATTCARWETPIRPSTVGTADPDVLRRFADYWPEATIVRLDDNHRSTPQVVAAAAAVLGSSGARPALYPGGRTTSPSAQLPIRDGRGARGGRRAAPGPGQRVGLVAHGRAGTNQRPERGAARASKAAGIPIGSRRVGAARRTRGPGAPWPISAGGPSSPSNSWSPISRRRPANCCPAGAGRLPGPGHGIVRRPRGDLGAGPASPPICRPRPRSDRRGFVLVAAHHGRRRRRRRRRRRDLHLSPGQGPRMACGVGLRPGTWAWFPLVGRRLRRPKPRNVGCSTWPCTRAERELRCSWAETRTFGQRAIAADPSPWLQLLRADASPPRDSARGDRRRRVARTAGGATAPLGRRSGPRPGAPIAAPPKCVFVGPTRPPSRRCA